MIVQSTLAFLGIVAVTVLVIMGHEQAAGILGAGVGFLFFMSMT